MTLNRIEHRELLRALRLEEAIPYELVDRATEHIAGCPKCQLVLKKNRHLRKKLNPMLSASHPVAEELLAFLTADNSAHAQSAAESFQSVKTHVETCAFCQSRVQHLRGEIRQVESLMQNAAEELAFEHDYQPFQSAHRPQPPKRKMFLPPMPKAILPVAGACGALLLLFFLSLSTRPNTYELAQVNSDRLNVFPIERGTSSAEVSLRFAESFINDGDYDQARLKLVEVDERKLSEAQLLRARLCDLMLTLKSAHRSFIHLFPHFEKSEVRKSLELMEEVLARHPSAAEGNEAYWGLAHYYCAKADLMLDDENSAVAHLQSARLTAHLRRLETDELLRVLPHKE